MRRVGRRGQLIIDDQSAVEGMARGVFTQLNLYQDLFVGGHPDIDEVQGDVNVNGSFHGCIQKVSRASNRYDVVVLDYVPI